MAENALFPAYVLLRYHSAYGAHTAVYPTREWLAGPVVPGNDLGSYENWAGIPCDGQEMVEDLVDALAAFYPASVIVDSATVYTLATPESPAIPRATHALGTAGTETDPGWSKAVQLSWQIRDTAWGLSKIVMLDAVSNNQWDVTSDISGSAESLALVGALTSTSWAWSSRLGNRPATFTKLTKKLNDKLRREYGMD